MSLVGRFEPAIDFLNLLSRGWEVEDSCCYIEERHEEGRWSYYLRVVIDARHDGSVVHGRGGARAKTLPRFVADIDIEFGMVGNSTLVLSEVGLDRRGDRVRIVGSDFLGSARKKVSDVEQKISCAITCYDLISKEFDDSILLEKPSVKTTLWDEVSDSKFSPKVSSFNFLVDDSSLLDQEVEQVKYYVRASGEFECRSIRDLDIESHITAYDEQGDVIGTQELEMQWATSDVIGIKPRWRISQQIDCLEFGAPLYEVKFVWRDAEA